LGKTTTLFHENAARKEKSSVRKRGEKADRELGVKKAKGEPKKRFLDGNKRLSRLTKKGGGGDGRKEGSNIYPSCLKAKRRRFMKKSARSPAP